MKALNSRLNRIIISLSLGIPSYAIFALIRNFPFENISLYSYLEYSGMAAISFFVIFEAQNVKSDFLNRFIPWKSKWVSRLTVELVSSLIITSIIVFSSYSFLYKVVWQMDIFMPSIYLYITLVFFISLSFAAIVNASLLINEWKQSIIKAETLEKENIQSRMEGLKTQLSPHFFFNNLSILNGLINDNPKGAKNFVSRMSDVFRYILSRKNDEIVPLKDEIEFIENYIYLLKIRFEGKFHLQMDINNFNYSIPPVTLQQ